MTQKLWAYLVTHIGYFFIELQYWPIKMTILGPFTELLSQNENIQETDVGKLEAKPGLHSEILPPKKGVWEWVLHMKS